MQRGVFLGGERLESSHLCWQTQCFQQEHLVLVTAAKNNARRVCARQVSHPILLVQQEAGKEEDSYVLESTQESSIREEQDKDDEDYEPDDFEATPTERTQALLRSRFKSGSFQRRRRPNRPRLTSRSCRRASDGWRSLRAS